jgi:hypothetical protein
MIQEHNQNNNSIKSGNNVKTEEIIFKNKNNDNFLISPRISENATKQAQLNFQKSNEFDKNYINKHCNVRL